jgi:heme exporter protein C
MRAWKWLLLPWLSAVILGAFLYAGEAKGFVPGASRIIFFHVPQAMLAVVGFLVSMIYAVRYLRRQRIRDDIRSETGAELGLLCCVLATVSGSLFAKVQWGSFWHWDPRESSIVVLMLIYGAYFALRASIEDPERRARLAATYAIFAFVTVPFLVFVVPRIPALNSLHPPNIWGPGGMSTDYRIVLYSAFLGFGGVFGWMFGLAVRVRDVASALAEEPAPAPAAKVIEVER